MQYETRNTETYTVIIQALNHLKVAEIKTLLINCQKIKNKNKAPQYKVAFNNE